jgi:Raf kinase inhibitor-like YbhB/YbcL family protein
MKRALFVLLIGVALSVSVGCGGGGKSTPAPAEGRGGQQMTMSLTSTAFAAGESIPVNYTCDGENVSPPLEWGQPPEGTQSLALIVDDPDAPSGEFVHWVIYDLPPTLRGLPEGVSTDERPSQGGTNGKNGANVMGYTGPCPPSGAHRYFFRLYAIDYRLDASPGLSKSQLLQAMAGDILAQGELIGVYSRGN